MGFFDRFRKKKEPERVSEEKKIVIPKEDSQPVQRQESAAKSDPVPEELPEVNAGPETSGSADIWDDDESLNLSMSKGSVLEETTLPGSGSVSVKTETDALSNEQISKGTPILDTYEVETDAIKGGMGSVWKVRHKGWNTDLAMKRPQPKFFAEGSEKRKENFVHECEAWINLGLHPNIVSCYYVREISGVPTIFSEWMENGSLKNRIDDGTLYEVSEEKEESPEERQGIIQERLLDIAIQFARGLHYAHESEDHLIHQDVKPDNLLLTKDWQAKVADFGLARARTQMLSGASESPETGNGSAPESDDTSGATHMAPTGGYTPAYCSFEQTAGKALSRRTDIYSWAVSVLEMYLGKRLWKRGTEAGRNCAEYFAQCRISMPEPVQVLVTQCLAEDPEKRPHDFGIIEEKLKEIYRESCGGEYPRPVSEAAKDNADSLNNRALSYLDLGREEEAERLWKKSLEAMPDHLISIYNQGLYQWRKAQIDDEELIRRMAAVRQDSDKVLFTRLLAQLSGERGISEEKPLEESSCAGRIEGSQMVNVALSGDGKCLFAADTKLGGDIRIFDTRTMECRSKIRQSVSRMAYSDRGRRLLAAHDETLEIMDANDTQSLVRGNRFQGTGTIQAIRLSPGGDCCYTLSIHYGSADARPVIRKIDLAAGKCVKEYDPGKYHMINTFEIGKDGKKLFVNTEYGIKILDERTGGWSDLPDINVRTSVKDQFCVSKDTESFYISGSTGLYVRHRHEKEKDFHSTVNPAHLLLSPDEKLLLTGGTSLKIWDTSTMRCLRTVFCGDDGVRSLAASEDLSVIVTGGNTIRIWNHAADPEVSPAPWELTVSKSYLETKEEQEQTEALASDMDAAIENKDWQNAFSALLAGEAEYGTAGSAVFRRYRRILTSRMKRVEIAETYENGVIDSEAGGYNMNFAVCPATGRIALAARKPKTGSRFLSVVKIMDEDLKVIREIDVPHPVDSAVFSPSGELLAVGMGDSVSVFRLDDDANETELKHFTAGKDMTDSFLRFSPDGKLLLIRNWKYADYKMKSRLSLWDMESFRPAGDLRCYEKEEKFEREIFDAQFTPDGRNIVSGENLATRQGESETLRNRLCIYDPATGEKILQMKQKRYAYYGEQKDFMTFRKVFFDESGDRIIAALRSYYYVGPGRDCMPPASVWDRNTGSLLEEAEPAGMEIMCQSPDRKLFAAVQGNDIITGTCDGWKELCRFSLPSEAKTVRGIAFSPSMSTLFVSFDKKLLSRELVWKLQRS